MTSPTAFTFDPTPEAAQARLQAVQPGPYARTRNALDGAVTGLSPYLTHGLLTVPQVIAHLRTTHRLPPQHKLVFELGWREFFRHLWAHQPALVERSLHPGPRPEAAYASTLPDDLLQARTGLAVIDQAVRMLYTQGWLHNHARMWLASYVVHLRGVHWRVGADWLWAHLLDGDLASNHGSWQWVAGTASRQPYLFNAENVRRHAPPDWWVDGSALDTSYDALGEIAAGRAPWPAAPEVQAPGPANMPTAAAGPAAAAEPRVAIEPRAGVAGAVAPPGLTPPPLWPAPPDGGFSPADAQAVVGRDVWLMHPWSLADPPPGRLPVAVCDAGFHARRPWSAARWRFVASRLRAVAPVCWLDAAPAIVEALRSARSVAGVHDPHLGTGLDALPLAPAPCAFTDPGRACASFSAWWSRVQWLD